MNKYIKLTILMALSFSGKAEPFFNDPFFNDPFFNDPFSRPIIKRFLNEMQNQGNQNKQEDFSYYIVISNEPGQEPKIHMGNLKPEDRQKFVQNNNPNPGKANNPGMPNSNPGRAKKPVFQPSLFPMGLFPMGGQIDPMFGQGNRRGQYNQYKPEEQKNKVTFKDVLGQSEAIKEVSEVVDFLKNPNKYHRLGAEMPKGMLLEGPPGTGKTLLARAVANEAGCTFIPVSGSQFVNKYVGQGAANIRKLFDQARGQAPAIIFIDEIDAVGSRERDENQEYRHAINELLTQLDGFRQEDNIIVMAATNFAKSLDEALLRPGRFDRIIKVGLPNKKGREDILRYYMLKKKLSQSVNVNELSKSYASRTTMFSGAKLKKLVNEATLLACRDNSDFVETDHFERAYDKIILGPKNHLERTKKQLERTAYHEVGHLVIKLLTDQPVAKVSILSMGDSLGSTQEKEQYETASEYQKDELLNKISGLYGGFAAEKVFLNSTRPGASGDLERVDQIARFMIRECGMGEGELEGIVCKKNKITNEMESKFEGEELRIKHLCRQKAENLLNNNKDLVHKFAKELLNKEVLTEQEIYNIYNQNKA